MKTIKSVADFDQLTPETLTITHVSERKLEKPRTDNKKQREYVTVTVEDGPMGTTAVKNLFQQYDGTGNPVWKNSLSSLKEGAQMQGAIIVFQTEPYFIPNSNGRDRNDKGEVGNIVNQFKIMATQSEIEGGRDSLLRTLNSQGHVLVGTKPILSRAEVAMTPGHTSANTVATEDPNLVAQDTEGQVF
jgi:hypothetical protein